jgi:hypothetical protein
MASALHTCALHCTCVQYIHHNVHDIVYFVYIQLAEVTCEASVVRNQLEQLKVGGLSVTLYDRKLDNGLNVTTFQ